MQLCRRNHTHTHPTNVSAHTHGLPGPAFKMRPQARTHAMHTHTHEKNTPPATRKCRPWPRLRPAAQHATRTTCPHKLPHILAAAKCPLPLPSVSPARQTQTVPKRAGRRTEGATPHSTHLHTARGRGTHNTHVAGGHTASSHHRTPPHSPQSACGCTGQPQMALTHTIAGTAANNCHDCHTAAAATHTAFCCTAQHTDRTTKTHTWPRSRPAHSLSASLLARPQTKQQPPRPPTPHTHGHTPSQARERSWRGKVPAALRETQLTHTQVSILQTHTHVSVTGACVARC